MFTSLRHSAAMLCAAVLLQGCASSGPLYAARSQFYSGQPQAALNTLTNETVSKRNRLLVHLDHGLIAHTAGNYEDSINAFKDASSLLDQIDFIGIREQTASLVTNDWVTSYKGEYSERLWIHSFQMMNFLLLGKPEGAAVEARQALQIYAEHGDALKNDWYSRTLIAMSFEAAGFSDSAHIEYKKLINDIGRNTGAARRAWQNARRLGRDQDAQEFKNLITTSANINNKDGELVVFIQSGSIPRKVAGNLYLEPALFASFPIYPDIPRPSVQVTVLKDGAEHQADTVTTQLVDISRSALAARGKVVAVKQIARLAAKKELARAIRKNTDNGAEAFLGGFLTAALYISEVADTRSWETLPAQVSMVQIPLNAGMHDVTLLIRHGARKLEVPVSNINIEAGKITYRSLRTGSGAPNTAPSPIIVTPTKALPTP